MKCRHCHIHLKIVNGSPFCGQCQSHYISFAVLEKLMSKPKFINFKKDSQKKSMISQYTCDFCHQRMTLHLNPAIQFESCFNCQQAWFEKGELEKINSKAAKNRSSESQYPMTEHISNVPLENFNQYEVQSSMTDLEAQAHHQQWIIITFIYESFINIIFYPIRYLIKHHPLILFLLLVVVFYLAKKYINTVEI